MDILNSEELAAQLDFVSPLHPEPEEPQGVYCIPFEWNGARKGTKISVAKAKEISAELRAQVAEAEKRIIRKAFDKEVERTTAYAKQLSEWQDKYYKQTTEVAVLHNRLRLARRKKK